MLTKTLIELKKIAKLIKLEKKDFKAAQREFNKAHYMHPKYNFMTWDDDKMEKLRPPGRLSYEFRYKHIAYCIVKNGTSIKQIEGEHAKIDFNTKQFLEELKTRHLQEIKCIKSKQCSHVIEKIDNETKLYTLVRRDLKSHGVRTVQAAHSVAEYLLRHPNTNWDNGTMVILKVEDLEDLLHWENVMKRKNIPYSMFKEPDLDNQYTSLTAEFENRLPFRGLRLL